MKGPNLLSGTIWLLVVGGNVVNTFTISPQVFGDVRQVPWQIAFLPIVVVFGAFMASDLPGERTFGRVIDQRFGSGSYAAFMHSLQPELMFSAMCFGIAVSGLARLLLGTAALPLAILGFFASGSLAFLLAYFIRKRRTTSAEVGHVADAPRVDRPPRGWRFKTIRVFAFLWGLGAGAAGFVGLEQDIHFRSQGAPVTGTIAGHTGEVGDRSDRGLIHYVVSGRTYSLTSLRGPGIYRIGDQETMRYMPSDPAVSREDDYLSFDLLFAGLGSGMLLLALLSGAIARSFARRLHL